MINVATGDDHIDNSIIQMSCIICSYATYPIQIIANLDIL